MKWLIILFLLAILVMFVVVRYRRQIQTGIYLLNMFRKMRQMGKQGSGEKQIEKTPDSKDIQLVRCAKCGNWLPQNTALKFSKNTFYCSSKCVESAIKVN